MAWMAYDGPSIMLLGGFWAIQALSDQPVEGSSGEILPRQRAATLWTRSRLRNHLLGGLPSGALLLVLTTSMSFSLAALYDYPSQIDGLHPWIDIVPWVWFFGRHFPGGPSVGIPWGWRYPYTGLRLGIASVALHPRREYKYTFLRHWLAWVPALASGHTWADAVFVIPIRKSAQVTILLSMAY